MGEDGGVSAVFFFVLYKTGDKNSQMYLVRSLID